MANVNMPVMDDENMRDSGAAIRSSFHPYARYASDYMLKIWSDENRFSIYRDIEGYAFEKLVDDKKLAQMYWSKTKVDINRIREIEKQTHHELQSFIQMLTEQLGESESRYLHYGLTSSDVLDTGFAVQLSQSLGYIIESLEKLLTELKSKAFEYKDTVMIGRSHGMYGEPITLGIKFARFYAEFKRQLMRVKSAKKEISFCSISGPMGNYTNISPEVEEYVAKKLGLEVEVIASQVIPRDRHAAVILSLASLAGSLENIATEIRLLQRSEVAEVFEPFGNKQKGSSAMPHKRNPIKSENITGLARIIRSSVVPALESITLWHERDMSHSSVERVLFPQTLIISEFAIKRITSIISGLEVDKESMLDKIHRSNGCYASHTVLLKMISEGMTRNEAYESIQRSSFSNQNVGSSSHDPDSVGELLFRTDYIFNKVFSDR